MLISFACMSEKVPGETCLPFPGGGPVCDCGLELGWAYLGSQTLSLGGKLRLPLPAFLSFRPLGGLALLTVPTPLVPRHF